MNKKELRKQYLIERQKFTELEIEEMSQKIAQQLLTLDLSNFQTFHIFLGIPEKNEFHTHIIIQALWNLKKTIAVPKMEGKNLLSCFYTPNTELVKNHWGIEEPLNHQIIDNQTIDCVIVPMLICDKSGNRLGYGGGFYDRFLAEFPSKTQFIGINFFEPINSIPIEEFDIAVDSLVTPQKVWYFGE